MILRCTRLKIPLRSPLAPNLLDSLGRHAEAAKKEPGLHFELVAGGGVVRRSVTECSGAAMGQNDTGGHTGNDRDDGDERSNVKPNPWHRIILRILA